MSSEAYEHAIEALNSQMLSPVVPNLFCLLSFIISRLLLVLTVMVVVGVVVSNAKKRASLPDWEAELAESEATPTVSPPEDDGMSTRSPSVKSLTTTKTKANVSCKDRCRHRPPTSCANACVAGVDV